MRSLLLGLLLFLLPFSRQPSVEPTVRIGLTQNAASVTVRSAETFTVEGRTTRSAVFASVLAVDPTGAARACDGPAVSRDRHAGWRRIVVMPAAAPAYRAAGRAARIDTRGTAAPSDLRQRSPHSTVVNELPLEA
jgi:hypothetical protein